MSWKVTLYDMSYEKWLSVACLIKSDIVTCLINCDNMWHVLWEVTSHVFSKMTLSDMSYQMWHIWSEVALCDMSYHKWHMCDMSYTNGISRHVLSIMRYRWQPLIEATSGDIHTKTTVYILLKTGILLSCVPGFPLCCRCVLFPIIHLILDGSK